MTPRTFKPWLEAAQAVVTIVGVIVGGIWIYQLFIMGRQNHPQATVEEKVSHVTLTPKVS